MAEISPSTSGPLAAAKRAADSAETGLPGPNQRRFGAVILAAGSSSRMGTPKQLLEIDGQPLVVRVVETLLSTPTWPIVVVLGSQAEKIRPRLSRYPVLVAENAAWSEGMAASIRSGIGMLRDFSRALEGALITPCDQPAFSAAIVEKLYAAQAVSRHSIVAARYAGRNGAPALFLRDHFSTLAGLTGEEGARVLLNGNPDRVAAVDLPELAFDLDTQADLEAWMARSRPD